MQMALNYIIKDYDKEAALKAKEDGTYTAYPDWINYTKDAKNTPYRISEALILITLCTYYQEGIDNCTPIEYISKKTPYSEEIIKQVLDIYVEKGFLTPVEK